MIANIPVVPIGADLKFRVTVTKESFSLDDDNFTIVIKNRWGRVVGRILKRDCYQDSQMRCYFNVENIAEGEHYAIFVGTCIDGDYGKALRFWNDRQLIFIGRDGCIGAEPHPVSIPDDCPVQYEQIWSVNVGDGEYLTDINGNFVYTSDGKRIFFRGRLTADGKVRMSMTGDEFLQLIEGRDPNGEVNTIPEMMAAMDGITDEETIPQKIQDEIDENEQENEASDSDIDSIFDQNP